MSTPQANVGLPPQDSGRDLRRTQRTDVDIARTVARDHRKTLDSRRPLDLTKELYMLHTDGGGSAQWAAIYKGQRIELPITVSSSARPQENLLRILVGNAAAQHTTMPFRFVVEGNGDRKSRESAKIDAALANHLAYTQSLNRKFAEAFNLAACWGFCPVHAFWRDDPDGESYEPLYVKQDASLFLPRKGVIDAFVGDPSDTVFNRGAKRDSIHWLSYGRVLPAELVSNHFGVEIKGSKRSFGSLWQRKASKWMHNGLVVGAHGNSALMDVGDTDEELVSILCREWAPGVLTDFPDGRLVIVALEGTANANPLDTGGYGTPRLLLDAPLPGKTFSCVNVYSDPRQDDVHGKPFVEDLDELQIDLNQYLAKRKERVRRSTHAALVTQGRIDDDSSVYDDDAHIEIDLNAKFQPYYLQLPEIAELTESIQDCRQAMYTIGGYQAASRGESHAGQAAAAIVALQAADDSIHGPTNIRFRESVQDYMRICWKLAKQYMDVPWLMEAIGEDYADLAEPYIDRTMLSDRAPQFKLVSAYGASPEIRGQEILNLLTVRDAYGEPLLTAKQARRKYPDQTLWDEALDPNGIKERRARTRATRIRADVARFRRQTGFDEQKLTEQAQAQAQQMQQQVAQLPPQWQQQAQQINPQQMVAQQSEMAAQQLFQAHITQMPLKRDDDPNMHIAALSEIVQDPSEDPLCVRIAESVQALYFEWLDQIAAKQSMAAQANQPPSNEAGEKGDAAQPARPTSTMQKNQGQADNLKDQVNNLTQQAKAIA